MPDANSPQDLLKSAHVREQCICWGSCSWPDLWVSVAGQRSR